jgi:hypothetical protein
MILTKGKNAEKGQGIFADANIAVNNVASKFTKKFQQLQ